MKARPFEQILRPLHEGRAVAAWLVAAVWCLVWGLMLDFGGTTIFLLVLMSMAMAGWRFKDAYRLARQKLSLIGKPIAFISTSQLRAALPTMGNNLWLGWGYRWEPRHTRRAYEVMKRDLAEIYPAQWMLKLLRE